MFTKAIFVMLVLYVAGTQCTFHAFGPLLKHLGEGGGLGHLGAEVAEAIVEGAAEELSKTIPILASPFSMLDNLLTGGLALAMGRSGGGLHKSHEKKRSPFAAALGLGLAGRHGPHVGRHFGRRR